MDIVKNSMFFNWGGYFTKVKFEHSKKILSFPFPGGDFGKVKFEHSKKF